MWHSSVYTRPALTTSYTHQQSFPCILGTMDLPWLRKTIALRKMDGLFFFHQINWFQMICFAVFLSSYLPYGTCIFQASTYLETCVFISKRLKLHLFLLYLSGNFPPAIPRWVMVLCIAKPKKGLFFIELETLRNDQHTFSSKIKIFLSVTLWTDNKIFCSLNCSLLLLLLSRDGKTFCVQKPEGIAYASVLPTSPRDVCIRSV